MEDNQNNETTQEKIEETVNAAKDASKLAANVASGNVAGIAKNAINLLKNKQFQKQLKKALILGMLKIILLFVVIASIAGILFSIFNTVTEKLADIASQIGDFASNTWRWITDNYWIDINKEILITAEDGTQKTQTIVDHYMEQLETLGISLQDLKLLGEADYSNPNLLEDEKSKAIVQKYLSEFVKADIISQEIHRQHSGNDLVNPSDEDGSEIDGGVYLYRTMNEVTTEGTIGLDNSTLVRMEYTDYNTFKKYLTEVESYNRDYDKAKKMFTIDDQTGKLLYYQVSRNYEDDSEDVNITVSHPEVNIEEVTVDYKPLIQKYAMPFEFLVNLCMITQNPEYVYHVAHLARNTNIQLVILDSIYQEDVEEKIIGDYAEYQKIIHLDSDEESEGEEEWEQLGSQQDREFESKVKYKVSSTSEIKVLKVDTWSYTQLNTFTNQIIPGANEGTNSETLPDEIESTREPFGPAYPDLLLEQRKEKTNLKKETTITSKSNEYRENIVVDEIIKTKQFLGLLRNDTGKCYNETCYANKESVQSCVDHAVFNKNGYNVSYRIPGSTRQEMPLSKLQSGAEMLYALLEMQNNDNTDELNNYNQKMQGLKEYIQYVLTFPENESVDLNDDEFNDFLNNYEYGNVTYGMFWWPLDPNADVRISSFFGPRRAPTPTASTNHGAIDIAVATGTDVLASADGVVEYVGYDPDGYGNYVTINHQNGYKTRYAHNSEILVQTNDIVTRGQVIAKSGSTGNSTGPHLHFEIHLNGTKIDPLDYVSITNKQPMASTYTANSSEQLDIIYAVVAQECASSYEGALAVISCVLNRCESPAWQAYGGHDPYRQITFSGQFAYSELVDSGQHYKQYLGGKAPDYVKQAVDDALTKGIRNHTYTRFRTNTEQCRKDHPIGTDIGGNWYF